MEGKSQTSKIWQAGILFDMTIYLYSLISIKRCLALEYFERKGGGMRPPVATFFKETQSQGFKQGLITSCKHAELEVGLNTTKIKYF